MCFIINALIAEIYFRFELGVYRFFKIQYTFFWHIPTQLNFVTRKYNENGTLNNLSGANLFYCKFDYIGI